ncbi:VOC family protein [Sanguibacter gelidistatuariae]|uniref:VOC family protein n=1 Tax=Sanguibacter gelidistatuariae TaxID=1814289 RepID=UPI000AFE582A|nr:VOC family protein [Sanguibacter gelidistatuariae]
MTDSVPFGAPCWIDLATSDLARATDFYGQLFGWTAVAAGPEYGGYVNCSKGDRRVAGMMANEPGSGYPDGWSTYLAVADAGATTSAVQVAGGRVLVEPMQVGAQGTMAVYADPTGAVIGAWQPAEHTGYSALEEHGTAIWHELYTTGYTAAVDFYRSAFGWDTEVTVDSDELRYTVQIADGVQRAGIVDASSWLPDGASSTWEVYFGSRDVAATLAQVTALGGSVVQDVADTPYGQLATAADPTGAQFKLKAVPS